MRIFTAIIISAALAGVISCKSPEDILATYKGGTITRAELHQWIEIKARGNKDILKKKQMQKKVLKEMALTKIAVSEAERSKFNEKDSFKSLEILVYKSFLSGYYKKSLSTKMPFKEDAVKLRIIRLNIKQYNIKKGKRVNLAGVALKKEQGKQLEIAQGLFERIKKGESFAEIAKKNSQDFSKKNGGDAGYVTGSMRHPDLMKVAFALKEGEVSNPVVAGNAVYIVKIEDRTTLTDKNVKSVIKDAKKAERLERRLRLNAIKSFEAEIAKKLKAQFNKKELKRVGMSFVVYSIGSKKVAKRDIQKVQDLIDSRNYRASTVKNPNRLDRLATRLYADDLFKAAAEKKGIDKEEKCKSQWKLYKNLTLAGIYMHDEVSSKVAVTEKDVRNEYNKMKKSALESFKNSKKSNKKQKRAFSFPPYKKYRDRLYGSLVFKKKRRIIDTWQQKKLKELQFKIDDSSLEGA